MSFQSELTWAGGVGYMLLLAYGWISGLNGSFFPSEWGEGSSNPVIRDSAIVVRESRAGTREMVAKHNSEVDKEYEEMMEKALAFDGNPNTFTYDEQGRLARALEAPFVLDEGRHGLVVEVWSKRNSDGHLINYPSVSRKDLPNRHLGTVHKIPRQRVRAYIRAREVSKK